MGSTASQGQTPSLVSAPSRRMSASSSVTSKSRKISRIGNTPTPKPPHITSTHHLTFPPRTPSTPTPHQRPRSPPPQPPPSLPPAEMVNMPGGAMVLEVDERDDDAVSILSRRDSLSGARTVGGVAPLPDTAYFDKKIKIEMAHLNSHEHIKRKSTWESPGTGSPQSGRREQARGRFRRRRRRRHALDAVNEESKKDKDPLLTYGLSNVLNHLCLALASPAFFRLPALAYKWGSRWLCVAECLLLLLKSELVGWHESINLRARDATENGHSPPRRFLSSWLPLGVLHHAPCGGSSDQRSRAHDGPVLVLGTVTIFRCLPVSLVWAWHGGACSVLMVYTSTVFTWSTLYLFDCMHKKLPWENCRMERNIAWNRRPS
ncbi:hypothetical protein C7M84_024351 [Penaeus vannamei]|uniref:Uncharacterized protein n=1 Tax=Penaeus vannamei TaxID=6689 RepID=A0A3R7QLC5_PENVA|nr:hypothetical protein C7M84_024351 [Penaeus vannamei]